MILQKWSSIFQGKKYALKMFLALPECGVAIPIIDSLKKSLTWLLRNLYVRVLNKLITGSWNKLQKKNWQGRTDFFGDQFLVQVASPLLSIRPNGFQPGGHFHVQDLIQQA